MLLRAKGCRVSLDRQVRTRKSDDTGGVLHRPEAQAPVVRPPCGPVLPAQDHSPGARLQAADTGRSLEPVRGHQSSATPRRVLQKVACCERGLSTACKEARKDNPHRREGRMVAAPAEGQLRALGPPSAPHPDCPPRPPCRETRGCGTADAGVGRCGTDRTAGWVSCRPANTAPYSCLRAGLPPKLLSRQVSANGRDTGHPAGHPGPRLSGEGRGG